MAVSKVQTGLRMEETLYEKVLALSKIEGRSLNNLVEYITRRYVEDYEAHNGPLLSPQD